MTGFLRSLPDRAPLDVTTIVGTPRSSVPRVPPDPSYSSTCSRTHWAAGGSYSPCNGIVCLLLVVRFVGTATPTTCSGLHLLQAAFARGLVLAPAQDLRAVADPTVGSVIEGHLDDQLGPQRD